MCTHTLRRVLTVLFNFLAHAVIQESDGFVEKLADFIGHRLQGVFSNDLAIGAPEVAHQNDGLGT